MARLTAEDIALRGKFALSSLLELEVNARANEHSSLRYRGMVEREMGMSLLQGRANGEKMTLLLSGYPAFTGVVRSVELREENGLFYLTVCCQDYSCLVDEKPSARFFQNTKMTYSELLEQLFADAEDASIICVSGEETIGCPILQYGETDWQFALRMAGKLETVIIPNLTANHSQLAIGVPNGHRYTFEGNDYVIDRHSSIRPGRERAKNIGYTEFLRYEIDDDRVFRLGDKITINGSVMAVMELSFRLENGALHNHYVLGKERGYATAYLENPMQAGLMLPGRVLSAAGEQVRVQLDIFDKCGQKTATDFGYAPQSNSGMYCMPEAGTKVMLKWQSSRDGDILAVHTVRENGQDCEEMKPCDRYLTTADGKRLAMLPETFYFRGGGNSMRLVDAVGVRVKTDQRLEIRAGGEILIRAGNRVAFRTPEQLRIVKTGMDSGINVAGGQMHVKSRTVRFQGDPSRAMKTAIPAKANSGCKINLKLAEAVIGMLPWE